MVTRFTRTKWKFQKVINCFYWLGMKPQNVPGHSRYGRGGSGSEFEMKLSDAWDIFQKRINVFSEIKQVNK